MITNTDKRRTDTTHIPLGLFCILTGAVAMWIARDYETGTVVSMGPGFFPKAVSGLLLAFGAAILIVRGRDLPEPDEDATSRLAIGELLRIVCCVIGSIVLFGVTLMSLGLPVSTFLMVLVASLARSDTRPAAILLTAIVLSVVATLLFAYALRLQIPVLPELLR
ncbi:tripartite tricarboxylate transporter TctB family protein [Pararhizobium polonicum]|nr:tripartite tricarboxylate transporter TctB family protein [Pararhizobium polonicum]